MGKTFLPSPSFQIHYIQHPAWFVMMDPEKKLRILLIHIHFPAVISSLMDFHLKIFEWPIRFEMKNQNIF